MRITTKRVIDPQYVIIYSYQDHYDETSYQRVLGVFSAKDKAIEQIESQIETMKVELSEFYDKLNVYRSDGFYVLCANTGEFSTQVYTFHVETFDKDCFYVCNMAE